MLKHARNWLQSNGARRLWNSLTPERRVRGFAAVTLTLAASTTAITWWESRQAQTALASQTTLTTEVARLQQSVTASSAAADDFTKKLPRSIDASDVAQRIQTLASQQTTTLVSLIPATHAASPKTLAHQEWTVTLRGTYPNIKTLLAALLESSPDVRLHALSLKRRGSSEVEAQLSLVQWLAPLDPAVRKD